MHPVLDLSELNRMVGRLFMAGMPGRYMDVGTEELIRDYCLGGIILFSRNIENPLQIAGLCKDLQDTAMKYHGIPLFIAVDQEGGRVARLKQPFTSFPGNEAIGADSNSIDRAVEFADITARELKLVGLNMDMAPVIDVRRGEPEKHLVGRTFSDNPDKVSQLGRTVVRVLQQNGVMAVGKHFPGLGRATMDPHHLLPVIEADLREIEEINLPPFKEVIAGGVSGIMTSHAIYPSLDPEFPATLSTKILNGILREKLGFQGLIITDDLEMGAINKNWGVVKGAIDSFTAGADILLISENQDLVLESMAELRGRILRNEIQPARLKQSIERIMTAKSGFIQKVEKVSFERIKSYFAL